MNAQPAIIQVPLSQLRLSPRNARKTGAVDVEGLAASIAAHNLLQNLTVTANDDAFEVVAGGRRLAAMQLLRDRGQLPADYSVPCKLIDDDDTALEASTAENTLREAMHPADQFDAFKGMIDNGRSIPDVAAHFGVAEIVVKQRLKLANVAPDLVQLYRDGDMDLGQLQALAITDDHDAQRTAWTTPKYDHERGPWQLRQRLTQREVPVGRGAASIIDLADYEAAGGTIRRDLFGNADEAWLQDPALVDKLAMDQLEAVAQAERDAGWAWAEAHLTLEYDKWAEYPHLQIRPVDYLPDDKQTRLDAIGARIAAIEDDVDDDSLTEEQEAALHDEYLKLENEADEIRDATEERWPTDAMQQAGVLVYIGHQGIEIDRGRLKPGQKTGKGGVVTGAAKSAGPDQAAAKAKSATLSALIVQTLSAHRSAVARHHIQRDPHLALALLLDRLIANIKSSHNDAGVLRVDMRLGRNHANIAPDCQAILNNTDGLPEICTHKIASKDRLAWLMKRSDDELLQLLAYALGQSFDGISDDRKGHAGVDALHAMIGFDMADHWNPGCDGFLTRIPRDLVLQAVTEAKGKDAATAIAGLKKAELVAEAGKQLAGTGWLPKPLRGASYSAGAKPATKAKKAAAKKKPAKKVAAK